MSICSILILIIVGLVLIKIWKKDYPVTGQTQHISGPSDPTLEHDTDSIPAEDAEVVEEEKKHLV